MLSTAAAIAAIILSSLGVFVFKDYLVGSLGMPFLFPSLPVLIVLVLSALLLALITVCLATLEPSLRASRQEPGLGMKG
jgi:hypothetical protein